jgi:hypothetical protein
VAVLGICPVHVPLLTFTVLPSVALPETSGGETFTGAPGAAQAVALGSTTARTATTASPATARAGLLGDGAKARSRHLR